jgi:organic hydroperoxide reductase OsmC/OhrA
MLVAVLYRTRVFVKGGRDGRATSPDDDGLDLQLKTHIGLCGAGADLERLLAVADATSFLSAITFITSQGGADVPPKSTHSADVAIGPLSQGGIGLAISLGVRLPVMGMAGVVPPQQRADRVHPFFNALCSSKSVQVTLADGDNALTLVFPAEQRPGDL